MYDVFLWVAEVLALFNYGSFPTILDRALEVVLPMEPQ